MYDLHKLNSYQYTKQNIKKATTFFKENSKTKPKIDFLNLEGIQLNKSNKLVYIDGIGERDIVPEEEIDNVICKYFEDPATTGGVEHLHERLGRYFIGISRRAVSNFIKRQSVTQLKRKTFNPDKCRGISIGAFPGHIVEIDLLFMEKADKVLNAGNRYICTMLDIFSGKVGAEPLKKK